jgi:hypothetical protein
MVHVYWLSVYPYSIHEARALYFIIWMLVVSVGHSYEWGVEDIAIKSGWRYAYVGITVFTFAETKFIACL